MNAKLATLAGIGALLAGTALFFSVGSGGTNALWGWSHQGTWLLPLIGVAAVVDSINPCAFSILLVTVAFLFSLGRLRSNVLQVGAAYILGIFLVYILIGLGLLQALHLFNTPHFMAKLGAVMLIGLGALGLVNHFVPAFPVKLGIPSAAHGKMAVLMEKASLPSAFVLGGLVGLCEFPCSGGPYLAVIGLLHDSVTHAAGLGYLFIYNVIFVAPLVVLLLVASDRTLLARAQAWKRDHSAAMRLWGGDAMVLIGVAILLWM